LTLEVLKVNIFRFKMQNDLISAYNQMAKKLSAPQKKNQNRPLGNFRVCPCKFRKLKGLMGRFHPVKIDAQDVKNLADQNRSAP
jgi:hypothetical protein